MLSLVTLLVALVFSAAHAAAPAVPNPSFETGAAAPGSWTSSGDTAWGRDGAAAGARFVTVRDGGQWCSDALTLRPGQVCELRVRLRLRPVGEAAPHAVIGPDFAIRVLGLTVAAGGPRWREQRLRFVAPDNAVASPVRLGDAIRGLPKIRAALFGHWHLPGVHNVGGLTVANVSINHMKEPPLRLEV
jgi:hypothetical protein